MHVFVIANARFFVLPMGIGAKISRAPGALGRRYSRQLKQVCVGNAICISFIRSPPVASERAGYAAANSASFATVFMLRAVPDLAARIFSFDSAMPFP